MTERDTEAKITPPLDPVQTRGSERLKEALKQFGAYTSDFFLSEMKRNLRRIAGEIPFALGGALIGATVYMATPEGTPYKENIPVAAIGLTAVSYFGYQGYRTYRRFRNTT